MSFYFEQTEVKEVSEFCVSTHIFKGTYTKTFPKGTYLPNNLTFNISPHDRTKRNTDTEVWEDDVFTFRESKKEAFRVYAKQSIEEPFYSEALGQRLLYDRREEDQSNITLQWMSIAGTQNLIKVYCHDGIEWVARDHNASQLVQVIKDMESGISVVRDRLYTTVSKLNASTTLAEAELVEF